MDKLEKKEFKTHIINWLKTWKRGNLKYLKEQKYFLNIFRKIIWWDYRHNKRNYSSLETEIFWLLNENQVKNIEKYIKWEELNLEIKIEVEKIGIYIFDLLSSVSHKHERNSFSIKKSMKANIWNSGIALEFFLLYFFKFFSNNKNLEFKKSDIDLESLKIDHLIKYHNYDRNNQINIASQISVTKYLDEKRLGIIKANLDLDDNESEIYKIMRKQDIPDLYSFFIYRFWFMKRN